MLGTASAGAEIKNESELGLIVTNGNSKVQSYNAKSTTKYLLDKNTFRLDANFLQSKQSGIRTSENWLLGLRYERELSSLLSIYAGQSVESDTFAGYLRRYNSDLGLKYFFDKKEKNFLWFAEAGYRFTHEREVSGIKHDFHKGRLYTEAEKYWAETTSTKLWVEYLPNFSETRSWLLNSEFSVSSALNTVFSVKSAFQVRYNHAPLVTDTIKTDTAFTSSLVAKL